MKWIYHNGDLLTPDEFAKLSAEGRKNSSGLPEVRTVERGRWRWDRDLQELVPIEEVQSTPVHSVIHDTVDSLLNHADARRYDSKRAFSRATRAAGYVEVGNETEHLQSRAVRAREERDRRQDANIRDVVQKSEHMLREGYRPGPLPRVRDEKDIRGDAW